MSLASKYATGSELSPDDFYTSEAIRCLEDLGFEVVRVGEDVEELEEGIALSLERDLEEYLARNIECLEAGLKLKARQKDLPAGRVDILAEDREGRLVAIELKAGEAHESSLTQLLAYISCLKEIERDREVRGILIANKFTNRVRYATRLIPYIKLKRYRVKFEFEDVE
ncbi:MAG: DUF91 domain-containing protein [Thermoproteales archaeon]|nr:DUF91 domain-containing protein [Thermoproteales archaeon]